MNNLLTRIKASKIKRILLPSFTRGYSGLKFTAYNKKERNEYNSTSRIKYGVIAALCKYSVVIFLIFEK